MLAIMNPLTYVVKQSCAPWRVAAVLILMAILPVAMAGPALAAIGDGQVLLVGPGRALTVPSAAAAVAQDGDIVEIDAGDYVGDVAVWSASDLLIRGVGGRARLDAAGQSAQGKGIWVLTGSNVVIENIEFANATVPDRNGAGIRAQGGTLVIRNCVFRNNEDGILTSSNETAILLVENSTFDGNGYGDGQSHGVYVTNWQTLVFRNNLVLRTRIGHHLKSLARVNLITGNRFADGPDGTASYAIDLVDPHFSGIVGNTFVQSQTATNRSIIHIGAAAAAEPDSRTIVLANTAVNERNIGIFVRNQGTVAVELVNNLLVGGLEIATGPFSEAENVEW